MTAETIHQKITFINRTCIVLSLLSFFSLLATFVYWTYLLLISTPDTYVDAATKGASSFLFMCMLPLEIFTALLYITLIILLLRAIFRSSPDSPQYMLQIKDSIITHFLTGILSVIYALFTLLFVIPPIIFLITATVEIYSRFYKKEKIKLLSENCHD